jgi:Flp pilus assembly pilin Flp
MKLPGIHSVVRRAVRMRRGAAMMEYVIIAVLIAAACVMAVVVFNRGIMRNTDLMNKAAAGRGSRAGEAAQIYQADAEADIKESSKFPNQFSDIGN